MSATNLEKTMITTESRGRNHSVDEKLSFLRKIYLFNHVIDYFYNSVKLYRTREGREMIATESDFHRLLIAKKLYEVAIDQVIIEVNRCIDLHGLLNDKDLHNKKNEECNSLGLLYKYSKDHNSGEFYRELYAYLHIILSLEEKIKVIDNCQVVDDLFSSNNTLRLSSLTEYNLSFDNIANHITTVILSDSNKNYEPYKKMVEYLGGYQEFAKNIRYIIDLLRSYNNEKLDRYCDLGIDKLIFLLKFLGDALSQIEKTDLNMWRKDEVYRVVQDLKTKMKDRINSLSYSDKFSKEINSIYALIDKFAISGIDISQKSFYDLIVDIICEWRIYIRRNISLIFRRKSNIMKDKISSTTGEEKENLEQERNLMLKLYRDIENILLQNLSASELLSSDKNST